LVLPSPGGNPSPLRVRLASMPRNPSPLRVRLASMPKNPSPLRVRLASMPRNPSPLRVRQSNWAGSRQKASSRSRSSKMARESQLFWFRPDTYVLQLLLTNYASIAIGRGGSDAGPTPPTCKTCCLASMMRSQRGFNASTVPSSHPRDHLCALRHHRTLRPLRPLRQICLRRCHC